jgi:hypothetical protein
VKKDLEETKGEKLATVSAATNAVFEGVDENMELDDADKAELLKFETV